MHFLMATDGSADGDAACRLLSRRQALPEDRATIVVVTPNRHILGAGLRAAKRDAVPHQQPAEAIASDAALLLDEAGYAVDIKLLHGDPGTEIERLAAESSPDLIVLGQKGVSTVRRLLMGSVALNVARLAPTAVLLVAEPASFQRVIVVSDNSAVSMRAARIVLAISPENMDHVTFLQLNHAGKDGNDIAKVFQQTALTLEESGVGVEIVDATGNEVETTLDRAIADEATLIVVAASDAMVGDDPVLGTTAHGLIERAPCSLLIAR